MPPGPRPSIRQISLRLAFRAPLDGAGLLAFLGRRAVPGVEELRDGAFARSLRLPHGAGVVSLRQRDRHVQARFRLEDPRDLDAAAACSRALCDLDCDPLAVADALSDDALIGPLVRATPGRRVPGAADGAELAVRAVLGQQVSLAGAATLAGRLVAAHGEPLAHPMGAVTHLFPSVACLAAVDPETLAMPGARRRALLGLADVLARGELELDGGVDHQATRRALLALPGIGPWTASYVAMRALGDRDAFLAGDLGVRRALERLGADGSPAGAERLARRWRPHRGYAMMHLWTSRAAASPLARERIAA
jgi:AraC family transcriptional regulator of adaptative response / DNA-3-methyladenine glycosylase II